MGECEYFDRHFKSSKGIFDDKPTKHLVELCNLTGQPCLVYPTSMFENCTRRTFAKHWSEIHPDLELTKGLVLSRAAVETLKQGGLL
jgi:hypothetical protein